MGRYLILTGLVVVLVGILVSLGDRLPFQPGRLPGDFTWRTGNSTFYFPLATSIILSVLLTALLYLFRR